MASDQVRSSSQRRDETSARSLTFQNVSSAILNVDWSFEDLLFSESIINFDRVSLTERPIYDDRGWSSLSYDSCSLSNRIASSRA